MSASTTTNEPETVGVDGCRGGWIAADNHGRWALVSEFRELLHHFPNHQFLIDIPLGLSEGGKTRSVEDRARPLLGRRSSSLFTPPCREALYADSYREASDLNRRLYGKGISIQCWNIVPRIREMDLLFREFPQFKKTIHEAHPELCFTCFNEGVPLSFSKKTAEGRAERLDILLKHHAGYEQQYHQGLKTIPRKLAAPDDLLDVLCLCLLAKRPSKPLLSANTDAEGIPMNLIIPA